MFLGRKCSYFATVVLPARCPLLKVKQKVMIMLKVLKRKELIHKLLMFQKRLVCNQNLIIGNMKKQSVEINIPHTEMRGVETEAEVMLLDLVTIVGSEIDQGHIAESKGNLSMDETVSEVIIQTKKEDTQTSNPDMKLKVDGEDKIIRILGVE